MKKYISLAAGLAMFAVAACTPSTPVADNTPTATATTSAATAKATKPPTTTNAESWQDYKSASGKFSVQVPSKPEEKSQDQVTSVGTIKLHMVIAETNESGYFIGYADFPKKVVDAPDIQKGLADSVKGSIANLKGEITSEKESLLGNIPCRDFEAKGKVKTTNVSMKGRFCFAGNRLYQVFALGAADKIAATDVDRFITSFKIDK
jgi:hypothetical protein